METGGWKSRKKERQGNRPLGSKGSGNAKPMRWQKRGRGGRKRRGDAEDGEEGRWKGRCEGETERNGVGERKGAGGLRKGR